MSSSMWQLVDCIANEAREKVKEQADLLDVMRMYAEAVRYAVVPISADEIATFTLDESLLTENQFVEWRMRTRNESREQATKDFRVLGANGSVGVKKSNAGRWIPEAFNRVTLQDGRVVALSNLISSAKKTFE